MVNFENVSFSYQRSDEASVNNISLRIKKGEAVLLCGESGCGKTTLIRMVNGLIPHFYEGRMDGKVFVGGKDVTCSELYETAKLVGSVFQNPRSQFFCVDSTSELAFGPENMGLPEKEILSRVDKTVREMGILKLMDRSIFDMSGGEKQKIACASVATLDPEVCVLDEPSSNLSLEAIEDLKGTLLQWKKEGKTIIVAEHRLYWLKEICDRVVCLKNGKVAFDMPMNEFKKLPEDKMRMYGLRSINENLEMEPVREHLGGKTLLTEPVTECPENKNSAGEYSVSQNTKINISKDANFSSETITLKNFKYSYRNCDALNIDKLEVPKNEVIAIVGPNGAGKSTFSKCICGLMKHFKGEAVVGSKKLKSKGLLKKSYMVMQDVNHQLFCETVMEEATLGMDDEDNDRALEVLDKLGLKSLSNRHPMSLSGGQKQRVAVASAILADKDIILFDEPTSGLDFYNMEKVAHLISSLRGSKTVFVVTHDPDLVRRCATVVLRMENGEIVNKNISGEDEENGREEKKCYNAAV